MPGKHRAPDDDPKSPRRPGPKHSTGSDPVDGAPRAVAKRPTPAPSPTPRKRAAARPTSAAPATPSPKTPERDERTARVADAAATAASVPSTAAPSVVGRAGKGAAVGAATGAAVGSAVPVVGTAIGAAGGAALGGVAGGVSGAREKKAFKRAYAAGDVQLRRGLVAEFAVCMLITALSPLTDKHKTEGPTVHIRRLSAVAAVFLMLGLISSTGRGGQRLAVGFGGLLTAALLVSERDVFVKLGRVMANTSTGSNLDTRRAPSPTERGTA